MQPSDSRTNRPTSHAKHDGEITPSVHCMMPLWAHRHGIRLTFYGMTLQLEKYVLPWTDKHLGANKYSNGIFLNRQTSHNRFQIHVAWKWVLCRKWPPVQCVPVMLVLQNMNGSAERSFVPPPIHISLCTQRFTHRCSMHAKWHLSRITCQPASRSGSDHESLTGQ